MQDFVKKHSRLNQPRLDPSVAHIHVTTSASLGSFRCSDRRNRHPQPLKPAGPVGKEWSQALSGEYCGDTRLKVPRNLRVASRPSRLLV